MWQKDLEPAHIRNVTISPSTRMSAAAQGHARRSCMRTRQGAGGWWAALPAGRPSSHCTATLSSTNTSSMWSLALSFSALTPSIGPMGVDHSTKKLRPPPKLPHERVRRRQRPAGISSPSEKLSMHVLHARRHEPLSMRQPKFKSCPAWHKRLQLAIFRVSFSGACVLGPIQKVARRRGVVQTRTLPRRFQKLV
eukprot:scaffold115342_cov72-Phaeocystis_antarctica.AAC.1